MGKKEYQDTENICMTEVCGGWMDIALGKRFLDLLDGEVFSQIFHPAIHPERIRRLYWLIFGTALREFPLLRKEVPFAHISCEETRESLVQESAADQGHWAMVQGMVYCTMEKLKLEKIDLLLHFTVHGRVEEKQEPMFFHFVALLVKDAPAQKDFPSGVRYLHPARNNDGFLDCPVCIVFIHVRRAICQWKEQSFPINKQELYRWLVFLGNVNGMETKAIVKADKSGNMAAICQELRRMGREQGREKARGLGLLEPIPWLKEPFSGASTSNNKYLAI